MSAPKKPTVFALPNEFLAEEYYAAILPQKVKGEVFSRSEKIAKRSGATLDTRQNRGII